MIKKSHIVYNNYIQYIVRRPEKLKYFFIQKQKALKEATAVLARKQATTMITDVIYSIMYGVNGRVGRFVKDFYVVDGTTYKMKVSANAESYNNARMSIFSDSLPDKMREINALLEDREYHDGTRITRLEVMEIFKEDALSMKATSNHFVELYYTTFEEDIEDWDSGIHKLIVFEIAKQ